MKLTILDIGGTEIKYSVMDETLERSNLGVVDTPKDSQKALVEKIADIYAQIGKETEGIAISMPGIIDADQGYCHTGGALEFNQGTAFAQIVSDRCGCPVHIDNDGKCSAMAELKVGSLKGCKNAMTFVIGTGVGGGLIIDGKIVRGKHFSAGELSFLSRGLKEWGTLDGLIGWSGATSGFLAELRKAKNMSDDVPLDGKMAFRMIEEGDEVAAKVLDDFTYGIAHEFYNLQMLLDVEKIAVGGGISKNPLLLQSLQRSFDKLMVDAFPSLHSLVKQNFDLVCCTYGNEANQIGAYFSYLDWMESRV